MGPKPVSLNTSRESVQTFKVRHTVRTSTTAVGSGSGSTADVSGSAAAAANFPFREAANSSRCNGFQQVLPHWLDGVQSEAFGQPGRSHHLRIHIHINVNASEGRGRYYLLRGFPTGSMFDTSYVRGAVPKFFMYADFGPLARAALYLTY